MKCAACMSEDVVGCLITDKDPNVHWCLCEDCLGMYEGQSYLVTEVD
jgi:hypothetical protein